MAADSKVFICTLCSACILITTLPKVVGAVSLSLDSNPSSIDQDTEFEIDVKLDCSNCSSASYLRGVFHYPQDSTSYSGFTQNNAGDWIDTSSDKTVYYRVDPQSSWSGKLRLKFDKEKPVGDYFLKVGRYTAGGSATWSESKTITVIGPSPTPEPTNTPKPPTAVPTINPPTSTLKPEPTVKNTATSTPKAPTSTPPARIATPTSVAGGKPTQPEPSMVTIRSTPTKMPVIEDQVIETASIPSPSISPAVMGTTTQSKDMTGLAIMIIIAGTGITSVSGLLLWQRLQSIGFRQSLGRD